MKRFPGLVPAAFLLLSLASCSAQITGRLARDASGSVELSAALEPNAASLIRGFASLRGPLPAAAPLLDAAALNRSLLSSPGVKSSALRNSAPESIAGTISISRIGDLLASETSPSSGPAPRGGFIRYEEPSGTAPGRLSLYLDRSQAPRILSALSPELADYLSALLAPAATGEELTRAEYLDLAASVYGKALAAEISRAKISVVIAFPGPVRSVKGGGFSGAEARFELPLLDLLVLEKPLEYGLTWGP